MVVGLKIVREDFGSLTSEYGRVFYPMGEWVEVPEPGAFVAIRGGLLSAGDGPRCIYLECEGDWGFSWVEGVYCFRRVRQIPPCPNKIDPWLREIAKLWEEPLDEESAKGLVENYLDVAVQIAALRRIEDQAFLEKIAAGEYHYEVKTTAVNLLSNMGAILKIANSKEFDVDVRAEAIFRIHDQKILKKLSCDSSDGVRIASLLNLRDKHRISEMARKDKNPVIRDYANRKIVELGGKK